MKEIIHSTLAVVSLAFLVATACSAVSKTPNTRRGADSGGSSAHVGGSGGMQNSGGASANSGGGATTGPLNVGRLRAEYRVNPIGIDVAKPRLDWLLHSDIREQRQTAYQVLVASTLERLERDEADLWDSTKVASEQSIQIVYQGKPIESRWRAWWKVRVWDKDGIASPWSAPAFWERGLTASDWQAKWIAPSNADSGVSGANWIWFPEGDPAASAPAGERYFRKSFAIPADVTVVNATCSMTVDDEFELFVNGTSLGVHTTWQDIKRLSIAPLLVSGNNVLAVRASNTTVSPAGLIAAVQISLSNGATLEFSSETSWKVSSSSTNNWQSQAFNDSGWAAAKLVATFGAGPWGTPSAGSIPAYFRKQFAAKKPKSARLYATALGIYELWLNGQRVGSDYLTPGFTDYRKRRQVQTYDVTSALNEGDNVIGAILADGWFNGKYFVFGRGDFYGSGPNRLLVQLEIENEDGSRQIVSTQGSGARAWKHSEGAIQAADLLDGETYDARRELVGWANASFDDTAWRVPEEIADSATQLLVADATDHVQRITEIEPVSVNQISPGVYIYDMGQNMVGWTRLRVQGKTGSRIKLRFGEVLNKDGTLYTQNLRSARATDTYILRGGEIETYEPRFTTHGFRYVELTGDIANLAKQPDVATLTGVVTHSRMTPTGTFESSAPMVNQLQKNIVWGQRGNFVSLPTDCPQRDERQGWLGDAQVFAKTATFNMDVASFFTKWMRDVQDGQSSDGAFSEIAPNPDWSKGTPAWGDAGVIVPWTMYLAYGDLRILDENYPAMRAWVEFIKKANPNFLWQNSMGSNYGDWLSINADSDKSVLATAFYAHSADLVARSARLLGKEADAELYEALFESIKSAFNAAYVSDDGKITSSTQTVYALALRFELVPEALRAAVAKQLAEDVQARGVLTTGFIGVAHLLPALSDSGRLDLAYGLLTNEKYPSWMYSINKGATTIWERWDGIMENGEFQTPGMNSFNHYSFGAVGEWMYSTIAGIEWDEAKPGYKHMIIRPQPGGGLTSASGKLDTMYGAVATDWKIVDDTFTLSVTVPVNTTANVYLPFAKDVLESGNVVHATADGSYAIGSGTYEFTAKTQ